MASSSVVSDHCAVTWDGNGKCSAMRGPMKWSCDGLRPSAKRSDAPCRTAILKRPVHADDITKHDAIHAMMMVARASTLGLEYGVSDSQRVRVLSPRRGHRNSQMWHRLEYPWPSSRTPTVPPSMRIQALGNPPGRNALIEQGHFIAHAMASRQWSTIDALT